MDTKPYMNNNQRLPSKITPETKATGTCSSYSNIVQLGKKER